jgi:hypothetical protein
VIDGFLHPLLAFGALLASVPLVIHLLNRRRDTPLAFAAMRFVAAAHRRTRRRARLESLLLLIARMLAVALLAFAVARPFVGGDGLLAGLSSARRDVVLLVDVSASTGQREGLGTPFERIVARAREIVESLDESTGDRVRVILVDDAPRAVTSRSAGEARLLFDTLTAPSPTSADLASALELVLACLDDWGARGSDVEVRFLTDLQRRTFAAPTPTEGARPDEVLDPLASALDRLAEREARVLVEDQGSLEAVPANAGVVAVEVLGGDPSFGTPARVEVVVRNFGTAPLVDLRVALAVEGARLPAQSLEVDAGDEARAVFPVRWHSTGEQALVASLAADGFALDDERVTVVEVAPPVRVALVNGAPSVEALELDEVGLLAAVLAPPGDDVLFSDGSAPFEPRVVQPSELESGALDLAALDVVWLANVAQLSTRAVESLTAWVRSGGALVFSMGDAVSLESFDARLFDDDGSGLLPARLLERRAVGDRRREYHRVRSFDETHPALAFFADERFRRLLVEVPIFEYVACVPLPDARVLAELDDGGAPLLVERDFGRGRVYLLTTTIDPAWTRLPESPKTLVPLAHEWLRSAARNAVTPRNVAVGEALVVESAVFPRDPVVVAPDGRRRPVDGAPQALEGGLWSLVAVEAADAPGLFAVEFESQVAARFAALFDSDEGDLARAAPLELSARHPALVPAADVSTTGEVVESRAQGELWRPLAAVVLALLVAESLYSAFVGRRRKSA